MPTATTAESYEGPVCKNLVLDAGPLLSFSPLRNLSQTYYIAPQVVSELKDPRAKKHFESLALNAGVRIQVRDPSPSSLAHGV
jgi:RNA-binding protein NOB1